MKKIISLGAMTLTLLITNSQAKIDNNACIQHSNFCNCYQADAIHNCQRLGGAGLCNDGMPSLLKQTSGQIKSSGGSLYAFCHGSIVKVLLKINPDDCMADNQQEFNVDGSIKKPDLCGWNQ